MLHSRLTNVTVASKTNTTLPPSPLVTGAAAATPGNRSGAPGTPKHLRFSVPQNTADHGDAEDDDDEDEAEDDDVVVVSEDPLPTVMSVVTSTSAHDGESTPPPPSDGWRVTPDRDDDDDYAEGDDVDDDGAPLQSQQQLQSDVMYATAATLTSSPDDESFHSTDSSSPLTRRSIKDKSRNSSLRSVRTCCPGEYAPAARKSTHLQLGFGEAII